jgi:predicted nucleotidyltransferase
METSIPKSNELHLTKYSKEDVEIARTFVKRIYDELGNFIKAAVIFGSLARKPTGKRAGDIDILLIVDDVTISLNQDLIETYRILIEKKIVDTSPRLHVTTLKFTSFWEYVRAGDPVAINILRDGVALIDTGFFDPLQVLLLRGRIRPTGEAIWSYYIRAPTTIHNSKWHIMQAVVDLYWAAIDSAHAALMKSGEIPPTPEHVPDLLEQKLVPLGLNMKYVHIMKLMFDLYKKIIHREIQEISGEEYSKYLKDTEEFVAHMGKIVEGKK